MALKTGYFVSGISASLLLAAAIGGIAWARPELRALHLPAAYLIIAAMLSAMIITRWDADFPVDDVGLWIVGVIALYGALPPLTYIVLGGQLTPHAAARLQTSSAYEGTVTRVAWLYVMFLCGFSVTYALLRRKVTPLPKFIAQVRISTALAVGSVAVICITSAFLVRFVFGVAPETYVEGYRVIQQLPLAIRQIYKLSEGMLNVLILAVLVLLFMEYRKRWPLIVLWVLAVFATTLGTQGSRTELMVILGACFVLFHRFVRRISGKAAISFAALGLIVFTALGMVRTLGYLQSGDLRAVVTPGEFEVVFVNAVDVLQRRQANGLLKVPVGVSLFDFTAFIPSQLLPFEKADPAAWYVQEYYPQYASLGGGLAFGSVTQAALGFGAAEAVVRGIVLGLLAAVAFRLYRQQAANFWVSVVYLWALVMCYQSVRNVTLVLVNVGLQQIIPTIGFVVVVAWALRVSSPPELGQVGSPATV